MAAWLENKKQTTQAIALYRSAIAAATANKLPAAPQRSADYWRWRLANLLKASGRLDEARKVVAEIDAKCFGPNDAKRFRKFAENLTPAGPSAKDPTK